MTTSPDREARAHADLIEALPPRFPQAVHGSRLGSEHASVRMHLAEDHGEHPGWLECASDGAHDGIHGETWAYSLDLPHPGKEVTR